MVLTLKTNLVMPSGLTSILKKQKMRLLTSLKQPSQQITMDRSKQKSKQNIVPSSKRGYCEMAWWFESFKHEVDELKEKLTIQQKENKQRDHHHKDGKDTVPRG